MFPGLGMSEIIVILLVAVVFIGPKKLPELAKTLGKGLGEFRRATNDVKSAINQEIRDTEQVAHQTDLNAKDEALKNSARDSIRAAQAGEEDRKMDPNPPPDPTPKAQRPIPTTNPYDKMPQPNPKRVEADGESEKPDPS